MYMGISVNVVDALAAILVFASMWRVLRYRELLYTCDVQSWMVYNVYHSLSAAALMTPQPILPSFSPDLACHHLYSCDPDLPRSHGHLDLRVGSRRVSSKATNFSVNISIDCRRLASC